MSKKTKVLGAVDRFYIFRESVRVISHSLIPAQQRIAQDTLDIQPVPAVVANVAFEVYDSTRHVWSTHPESTLAINFSLIAEVLAGLSTSITAHAFVDTTYLRDVIGARIADVIAVDRPMLPAELAVTTALAAMIVRVDAVSAFGLTPAHLGH